MQALKTRLPVFFLSHGGGPGFLLDFHGSPFQEIDSKSQSAAFMRSLCNHVSDSIKSILVVSAHWEEKEFTVDARAGPSKLHYDYSGFPEEAYDPYLTYPVQVADTVAERAYTLIASVGIKAEYKVNQNGLDHGVFIPLKVAFPDAKIPVAQISLKTSLDLEEHVRLGEALAPLRDEGVLILCSGQITHNLRELRRTGKPGQIDHRTTEFTNWFKELLENTNEENYAQRRATFIQSPTTAPNFLFAHPRAEHFVPLAVAFGAGLTKSNENQHPSAKRIYDEVVLGNMALDCYIFQDK